MSGFWLEVHEVEVDDSSDSSDSSITNALDMRESRYSVPRYLEVSFCHYVDYRKMQAKVYSYYLKHWDRSRVSQFDRPGVTIPSC